MRLTGYDIRPPYKPKYSLDLGVTRLIAIRPYTSTWNVVKLSRLRQTLILSQPKTPEQIVTKFEWRDYVVDPYHQKLGQSAQGFLLPI